MPDTIQFGNGNQILNRYSADGQKLSTTYITAPQNVVVPINSTINSQGSNYTRYGTKYCGNIEYEFNNAGNTSLKRISNNEGYVDFEPGGGDPTFYFDDRYNYYRKDHLGNVREVWRAPYSVHFMDGGGWGQEVFPAQTVQRTQYYPSGLPWKSNTGDNPDTQPYKYGGKEFVEMHGYDSYDYGARVMYPAIGPQFMIRDPLCEKKPWLSPYVYCSGNPVNRIDPDGRDDIFANTQTKQLSVIRTNDNFDRIVTNNNYAGNLEKGYFLNRANEMGITYNEVSIKYGKNSDPSTVSLYTTSVLVDVMNETGNSSIQINSTARSVEDQVRVMADMVESRGMDVQKQMYSNVGDQVLDQYPDRNAMAEKAKELGPSRVSKHCVDPSQMNVVDVSPVNGGIKNGKSFSNAAEKNKHASRVLSPWTTTYDPAIHIEIPQP